MQSVLTVRVDRRTRQRLSALAKRRRVRESVLVREALETFLANGEEHPYDVWAPSIGMVASGRKDLSEQTGRKFAELLKRRAGR
jgi:hypothetical protein